MTPRQGRNAEGAAEIGGQRKTAGRWTTPLSKMRRWPAIARS